MSVKVKACSNEVREEKLGEGIARFFKVIDKPGNKLRTCSSKDSKSTDSTDVANNQKPQLEPPVLNSIAEKTREKNCKESTRASGAVAVPSDSSVVQDIDLPTTKDPDPVQISVEPIRTKAKSSKAGASRKRKKLNAVDKLTWTNFKKQNSIEQTDADEQVSIDVVVVKEVLSLTVANLATTRENVRDQTDKCAIPVSEIIPTSKLANKIIKTATSRKDSVPRRKSDMKGGVTVISYAEFLKDPSIETDVTNNTTIQACSINDGASSVESCTGNDEITLVLSQQRTKIANPQLQPDKKSHCRGSSKSKKQKRRRSSADVDILSCSENRECDNGKCPVSKVNAAPDCDVNSASSKLNESCSDEVTVMVVSSQRNKNALKSSATCKAEPKQSCKDKPNAKKPKRHLRSIDSDSKSCSIIKEITISSPKKEQDGPCLRRSSRLSCMAVTKEDHVKDSNEKESKRKLKDQRCQDSGRNSSPKHNNRSSSGMHKGLGKTSLQKKSSNGTGVPLAPLFVKKSKQKIDRVLLEKRKSFLMSGIPEKLQKQIQLNDAFSVSCAASTFPAIQHIQQRETSSPDSLWQLKVPEALSDLSEPNGIISWCNESTLRDVMLTSCEEEFGPSYKLLNDGKKNGSPKLEASKLLDEIVQNNTTHDVKAIYEGYVQKRRRGWQNEVGSEISTSESKIIPKLIHLSDDENELVKKANPVRKGKRTKNAINGDDKQAEDVEINDLTEQCSSDLWTTVHQPDSAKEIVGNAESVGQLESWLKQWKKVCLNSWKKEQASSNRSSSKKRKKNAFSQIDSDYDSGSDSSDNGNDLCNTVLLVGPNGCGKTSTVFALAKELGFEVIEVNAASKRTGKLVLSRLREATQSHHVSDLKSHALSPSKVKSSFFSSKGGQKSNSGCSGLKVASGAQNPEKSDENGPAPVSLILFEDVDIVFTEDDGFWSAVNTFMSSAKRPLILTSSDLMFAQRECIKENYVEVKFQRPDAIIQALHLQLIALAELSFCNLDDLIRLVKNNSGDYRRSMLMLQLYCKHRHQGISKIWEEKIDCSKGICDKATHGNTTIKSVPAALDQPVDILTAHCCGVPDLFWQCSLLSVSKLFAAYVELLVVGEVEGSRPKGSKSVLYSECESGASTKLPCLNNIEDLIRVSNVANSLVYADVALSKKRSSFVNNANVTPGLEDDSQIEDGKHPPVLLATAVDTFLNLQDSILRAGKLKSYSQTVDQFEEHVIRPEYCFDTEPHNVLSLMPLETRLHRRDFHLDYLPALRNICHTESFRNSTSAKRRGRFSHYLSSNALYMDKDTIDFLSSHFQQNPDAEF